MGLDGRAFQSGGSDGARRLHNGRGRDNRRQFDCRARQSVKPTATRVRPRFFRRRNGVRVAGRNLQQVDLIVRGVVLAERGLFGCHIVVLRGHHAAWRH